MKFTAPNSLWSQYIPIFNDITSKVSFGGQKIISSGGHATTETGENSYPGTNNNNDQDEYIQAQKYVNEQLKQMGEAQQKRHKMSEAMLKKDKERYFEDLDRQDRINQDYFKDLDNQDRINQDREQDRINQDRINQDR